MRREDEDDEARRTRIIPDGGSVRVGLMMMDSLDPVQKAIAATAAAVRATTSTRLAPGRTGYTADSADNLDTKMRARDQAELQLSNAWKGGLDVGDAVNFAGRQMTVDCDPDSGRPVLRDASEVDGEAARQEAYDAAERDLNDAWAKKQKPAPDEDEDEKSKREKHEWEMAGPLSDATRGQQVRDQAWRDSVDELENAWRR